MKSTRSRTPCTSVPNSAPPRSPASGSGISDPCPPVRRIAGRGRRVRRRGIEIAGGAVVDRLVAGAGVAERAVIGVGGVDVGLRGDRGERRVADGSGRARGRGSRPREQGSPAWALAPQRRGRREAAAISSTASAPAAARDDRREGRGGSVVVGEIDLWAQRTPPGRSRRASSRANSTRASPVTSLPVARASTRRASGAAPRVSATYRRRRLWPAASSAASALRIFASFVVGQLSFQATSIVREPVVGVAVDRRARGGGRLPPQRRAADDRELEPLRRVHGHDLHRVGVGLDAARGGVDLDVLGRRLDRELVERGEQPGRTGVAGRGGREQLGDVVEIGHGAVAVGRREHPRRDAALRPDRAEELGDAAVDERLGPAVEPLLDLGELGVVGGDELARPLQPTNQLERDGAGPRGTFAGWATASSSQRHWVAAGDRSTVSPRAMTAGMPSSVSASRTFGDSAWAATSTAMSSGWTGRGASPDGRAGSVAVSSRSRTDQREVGEDHALGRVDLDGPSLALGALDLGIERESEDHPRERRHHGSAAPDHGREAQRLDAGGTRCGRRRRSRPGSSASSARSTASSDRQLVPSSGALGARRLDGVEVGVHVGPAEPVDGLLRVADEHERGAGALRAEQRPEDLPLDRIGVLELVDERDAEAPAHRGDCRRTTLAGERVAKAASGRRRTRARPRSRRRRSISATTRSTSTRRSAAASLESSGSGPGYGVGCRGCRRRRVRP